MSRIYFRTRDEGDAELLGSERAHMGGIVNDVAFAFVPPWPRSIIPFVKQSDRADLGDQDARFMQWFRLMLNHGGRSLLLYQGDPVETFSLQLNTVLAIGNDPLCLLAKLHAQCELHAYVEGPDRAWLAEIIDQGRASGLYRQEMGWETVASLLRSGDSSPVVTSYSVTDSFPNSHVANWVAPVGEASEPNDDAWYDLPDGERWDLAMAGLRADSSVPALSPEILRATFDHGLAMWDIFNQAVPKETAAAV